MEEQLKTVEHSMAKMEKIGIALLNNLSGLHDSMASIQA